jgi:signal transduction histidine kinase
VTRRLLGPVGGPIAFVLVAGLVFTGLGWVTVAALRVEDAQREGAAHAEVSNNLRVAMWRLDGRLLSALGVENARSFQEYAPPDPNSPYGPTCGPLLTSALPDWMRLHVQLDADTGWESPQVLTQEAAERFREAWPGLQLRNATPERARALDTLRAKHLARSAVAALSGRGAPPTPEGSRLAEAVAPRPQLPAPGFIPPAPLPAGAPNRTETPTGRGKAESEQLRLKKEAPAPAPPPRPAAVTAAPPEPTAALPVPEAASRSLERVEEQGGDRSARARAFKELENGRQAATLAYPGPATNPNYRAQNGLEPFHNNYAFKGSTAPVPYLADRNTNLNRGDEKGLAAPAFPGMPLPQMMGRSVEPPAKGATPGGDAAGTTANQMMKAELKDNATADSTSRPEPSLYGLWDFLARGGRDHDTPDALRFNRETMPKAKRGAIPDLQMKAADAGKGYQADARTPNRSVSPPGGAPGGFGGGVLPPSNPRGGVGGFGPPGSGFGSPTPTAGAAGGGFGGLGGGLGTVPPPASSPAMPAAAGPVVPVAPQPGSGQPVTGFAAKVARPPSLQADPKAPPPAGAPTSLGAPLAAASPPVSTPGGVPVPPAPALPPVLAPADMPVPADGATQLADAVPPVVAVHLGPVRPQWLTAPDGSDTLVLVRTAKLEGRTVYQGVVLDWPQLQKVLRDDVKDLFPEATLVPVKGSAEGAPERAMTALPVQLDPGPAAAPPPPGWTPLRIGLALAWAAALIAFGALGLAGWSLIDLSERRIRFVSAVTHELRTPLTSLRLYLDLLLSGMVQDEQKRTEYLSTLAVESDRLHRLVDNVLDFARLERRRPGNTLTPAKVADLLAAVRDTWTDRCGADGKELIVVSTLPPEAEVTTDAALVGQIVGNLIDNARKYTRGASDPRVWVWAKPEGRRVVLEVEDRGPGVPPRERSLIFRPFRRGAGADTTAGGAGLGLALCRQWAESLGGSLTYRPADGDTGSCFRLELPGK